MTTETYTKASFWKCALQVNPAGYIKYRGTDHGMSEEDYNQNLLQVALDNGINVIGWQITAMLRVSMLSGI